MACSTQQVSFMHLRHENSLLCTPAEFGLVLLPWGSKNDDEEFCFLK